MAEEKRAEYLMLREEILYDLSAQQSWSKFAITATITIIGFASQLPNFVPEMYLLPLAVLLIASTKVYNFKGGMQRIVSYMITELECKNEFYWETSLNSYRKVSEGEKEKIVKKIQNVIETQEFSIMALLCLILYNITLSLKFPNYFIYRIVFLNIISIIIILIIFMLSMNYWGFSSVMLKKYKDIWGLVSNDLNEASPQQSGTSSREIPPTGLV